MLTLIPTPDDTRDNGKTRQTHGLVFNDVSTDSMGACIALVTSFDYIQPDTLDRMIAASPIEHPMRASWIALGIARTALVREGLR